MVPSPPLLQQTPPAIDEIVHRVVPGDTLWDIAAHYLDDPFQYPELARLSQIRNPHLIYPGDIIHIIQEKTISLTYCLTRRLFKLSNHFDISR